MTDLLYITGHYKKYYSKGLVQCWPLVVTQNFGIICICLRFLLWTWMVQLLHWHEE